MSIPNHKPLRETEGTRHVELLSSVTSILGSARQVKGFLTPSQFIGENKDILVSEAFYYQNRIMVLQDKNCPHLGDARACDRDH